MSAAIRSEVSEKNQYWIERHRYYELKHFCLQYPIWKKVDSLLDGLSKHPDSAAIFTKISEKSDPTARCAVEKAYYCDRMKMIEQAAIGADPDLADYLLKGITEGQSYDALKTRLEIPCSRDTYYDRYRRFFWLLDKTRN